MNQLLNSDYKIKAATATAAIVVGNIVVVAVWKLVKRYLRNSPPKKWRKVGEISELLCYPIKSCGWLRTDEFHCNQVGVQDAFMRDRTFMVVDEKGEFVTARKYPKLVQVMPTVENEIMKLSAPGTARIEVDFVTMMIQEPIEAVVWGEKVKVFDAGDEAAHWFSQFILEANSGLRLVFYPLLVPTRDVREKNKVFDTAIKIDTGALHDATSFMMINEGSVDELNTRIEKPVTPLQFRPNFVVKGPNAYDEDKWKWVKIGDDVIFRNVKPCTRCIFTNIDPHSGERNPKEEPLKTLKSYRLIPKGGDSPVMGIHLGIRRQGKIKLNDAVYVEDEN